jgi:hypothetical protein
VTYEKNSCSCCSVVEGEIPETCQGFDQRLKRRKRGAYVDGVGHNNEARYSGSFRGKGGLKYSFR